MTTQDFWTVIRRVFLGTEPVAEHERRLHHRALRRKFTKTRSVSVDLGDLVAAVGLPAAEVLDMIRSWNPHGWMASHGGVYTLTPHGWVPCRENVVFFPDPWRTST